MAPRVRSTGVLVPVFSGSPRPAASGKSGQIVSRQGVEPKASARVVDDFEHFVAQLFRPKLAGECVLVAELLVACDPAENGGPTGHPGFATDGAKAFALGKPGADRYGDLKAIIRGPAAPWVGHQSFRLTQRISRSAAVTGVPCARITSGCRPINSFANIRSRSVFEALQRTSIRTFGHRSNPTLEALA